MRLFYHFLVFMTLAALTFQVLLMREELHGVHETTQNTSIMVALLGDNPPEKPEAHIKRFKPQPIKECPWVLKEPARTTGFLPSVKLTVRELT